MIQTKRVYEPPSANDGKRFLVDRLWPRGVSKDKLRLDEWLKDVAPSKELRHWFKHDPSKWAEFQRRYQVELNRQPETWQALLDASRAGRVTLLFSAHDLEHNNAVALKIYLEQRLKAGKERP